MSKAVPVPNHEYGYTWDKIETLLTPEEVERLSLWLNGQTMVMGKNGEAIVFADDFERWYRHKDTGIDPVIYD